VICELLRPTIEWLGQLYPRFSSARVRIGKLHPIDGNDDNANTDVPSGKALARQLIYGSRYSESRFGLRIRVAWLPDSIGLIGALL
jgi:alpha-mannosidase